MPSPTAPVTRANQKRALPRRELDVDVWTAALDRVARTYENFDEIVVSFSGGKDSTATLHVALEVAQRLGRLPVRAVFFDEEAIPYETEDYVRRVARRDDVALEWYSVPVKHRNACSEIDGGEWYTWAPEDETKWCRPKPPESIVLPGYEYADDPARRADRMSIPEVVGLLFDPTKRTAVLMGIRAGESLIRLRAVSTRTQENYVVRYRREETPTLRAPAYKIYPIYDWTTEDVWTAPALLGWDYNRAYDLMEMAGIPHATQRCAPPYGEEPMGGLWMFRTCFPDLWDRMVERVPGAATAARYATTELYSFGEAPPKPPDLSWEQHIVALLANLGPDAQALTAKHVRKYLRAHYRKTAQPILPYSVHPDTGVSWHVLSTWAARGVTKGRKQPVCPNDPEWKAKRRGSYDDEYARLVDQLGYPITADNAGDVT